ncbi:MAG TPA: hypothetical protein ENG87_02445 [Candidatus Pacearchaeota archaeon]|nr:hypothetical protein [Candidatus Pacearchaeota archaeon]
MVANIIFSYALIPQIYSGFKTKKGLIEMQTSTIMALGLYAVAIAFLSLDLYFSAIMVSVSGTLWVILLIQKIKYQ